MHKQISREVIVKACHNAALAHLPTCEKIFGDPVNSYSQFAIKMAELDPVARNKFIKSVLSSIAISIGEKDKGKVCESILGLSENLEIGIR